MKYALEKPGTAGVDEKSTNPSLEDVIQANQMSDTDLTPAYDKMKDLQNDVSMSTVCMYVCMYTQCTCMYMYTQCMRFRQTRCLIPI